jgi:hypothetical protein
MRNLALSSLSFAALSAIAAASGCHSAERDLYDSLSPTGTGTAGTGGLPSDCQGDPTKDPSLVRDECGAFVDPSSATNGEGTNASPYRTVGDAAKTSKGRIFVCASAESKEPATVTLSNGVSVYGGFSACPKSGDWTWDGTKHAKLTGPANEPAVVVSMGQSHIENVDITSPAATMAGGSSIALVADMTTLSLVNVVLTAGDGMAGADGMTPPDAPMSGAPGVSLGAGSPTDACSLSPVGGMGGMVTCADGVTQGGSGGKGGTMQMVNGMPGTDGMPAGGAGGMVDANGVCSNGKDGDPGMSGDPGKGGTEKGILASSGISGGDGADGKPGALGHGGGGGAGSKSGQFCPNGGNPPVVGPGASGGGGGSGGCGGKGGGGGKAGGSSIGIVSVTSSLTFSGVSINTGSGAKGGLGAFGQSGGDGGKGADGGKKSAVAGSVNGCAGGKGGDGGSGGQGGGGRGGHSAGVAFTGTAPTEQGVTFQIGKPGAGGTGNSMKGGDGAMGATGNIVDFSK